MGTRHPMSRKQQIQLGSETDASIRQHIQAGNLKRLEEVLRGSTREFRRSLFRASKELRGCVHEAIKLRSIVLLRFLVEYCETPLEERNADGVTPLYNAILSHWSPGALLLLEHGADVRNADSSLSEASCKFLPLVHAVLRTGCRKLLEEAIKRGADIHALDLEGRHCLSSQRFVSVSRPNEFLLPLIKLLQDEGQVVLYDIVHSDMYVDTDLSTTEKIIQWKYSQDPEKMMLVLGARLTLMKCYDDALDCWRTAQQNLACLHRDTDVDKDETTSVFADILRVDKESVLEGSDFSDERILQFHIQALLIYEKHAPTDKKLTRATAEVVLCLLQQNKITIALDVLRRLATLRALHHGEAVVLIERLYIIRMYLKRLPDKFPVSSLLHALEIVSKCLSFLTMDGFFSTDRSLAIRHNLSSQHECCDLCFAVSCLSKVFLETVNTFYERELPPTSEQLHNFLCHAKDIVSRFPCVRGQSLFHCLDAELTSFPTPASVIRTLVACSAEAQGTNRQENSPPHLSSDRNGDTPLHIFARHLRVKDLVEEGVLQCFLDQGAHLCTRNNQDQSVRDILVERKVFTEAELLPPLQCLAAAAFMRDAKLKQRVSSCGSSLVRHFLLDH